MTLLTLYRVPFFQIDLHFMKKIPPGAEACNVLVGELEFLNKPVVAFVRLSPAVLLSGLAEVPIATRLLQMIPIQLNLSEISLIYPAEPRLIPSNVQGLKAVSVSLVPKSTNKARLHAGRWESERLLRRHLIWQLESDANPQISADVSMLTR